MNHEERYFSIKKKHILLSFSEPPEPPEGRVCGATSTVCGCARHALAPATPASGSSRPAWPWPQGSWDRIQAGQVHRGHSKPVEHYNINGKGNSRCFEYLFCVRCLRFLFFSISSAIQFCSLLSLHNSSTLFFLPRREMIIFVLEILNFFPGFLKMGTFRDEVSLIHSPFEEAWVEQVDLIGKSKVSKGNLRTVHESHLNSSSILFATLKCIFSLHACSCWTLKDAFRLFWRHLRSNFICK